MEIATDDLGRALEIAGAGVITEARPFPHNRIGFGFCKAKNIGKSLKKP